MLTSFYKFHPDIPLYVFTNKDIQKEIEKYPQEIRSFYYLNPVMSKVLSDEYEKVVHIDADCIVTDRLAEVIDGDYEVATVRNNHDFGGACNGPPETFNGMIDWKVYANCGLIASSNKKFWDRWIELNIKNANKFRQHEQDIVNYLLHKTNEFSNKLLDPIESDVYYGLSNAYGKDTLWDSWKDIEVINESLYLNNKKIKILHNAGGFVEKLNIDKLFNDKTAKYLKELCNEI
jgi:hypothetical protein